MSRRLRIRAGQVEAVADLASTPTADALWAALPLAGRANRWGDEIYFEIPLDMPQEKEAREVMEAGEIAYWPPGTAFCIFFGRTPASRGDEIRAASPVNVLGRIAGDATVFTRVRSGTGVTLERDEA